MNINYYEVSIEDASRRLRGILGGIMDVKVAVLFGSILRRNFIRDLDVGVFMNPEPNLKRIAEISGILEDALGLPVDIIPLNWASPKLKLKALLNSVKLIVGDSNLYTSLLKEALSEAMDLDLKIKYMEKMHY
ncbi:MAG: nucleotidyltransferase domain-containing protein [archaeon YNP-LCB-003-016]|uniref:nucleotidyltransferase family protein n=1 Tax=Candidatus Culexarchaeum yellowstonense TaxID=2928963 RepID=UPI0026EF06C0|nr:nucleotidyltransferase domain-containing protein [Candidatus Culexarchaeum yellowstonense]MCR6692201.1 nucleotidyltransferase domain-containing protein [Candidatus Culexarchaeum yellowstonense]